MADKPIVKLQFAPKQTSPTLKIGHGEYRRDFDAKDQPFECDKAEAAMLLRTGHFVEAVNAPAQPKSADEKKTPGKDTGTPIKGKIGGAPPSTDNALDPGQ